jgi:dipeptidase E
MERCSINRQERYHMIIAIGGGEVYNHETYAIDQFIVASSNIDNPNLLFIPTASGDAQSYVEVISDLYTSLGCTVDSLLLCEGTTTSEEAKSKIEKADIIYVGGGNTEYMMDVWREYSVDRYLLDAYQDNKVLSGLSAGSICWFVAGHSDSEFVAEEENPTFKWVKGLGIIPYLHCPHYDEESRKDFEDLYIGQTTDAIAIENQVAIVWQDGEMRVIKANPEKNAYRLSWSENGLVKERLT